SIIHRVVAALVLALMARLHDELAILGEFQDLRVLGAVAAEPDVALVVDGHAVHRLRPLVALTGRAPGVHDIAVRTDRHYRRCRPAADRGRRIELGALLVVVERGTAAVHDP